MLTCVRLFQNIHSNNKESSKRPTSGFTKMYPFRPPLHSEFGGQDRICTSLMLYIGIDIGIGISIGIGSKNGTNNNCLLCPDVVFI